MSDQPRTEDKDTFIKDKTQPQEISDADTADTDADLPGTLPDEDLTPLTDDEINPVADQDITDTETTMIEDEWLEEEIADDATGDEAR